MDYLLLENYILNFNFFIISVSFIILIFSKKIIGFLDTTDLEKKHITNDDEKHIKKKIQFLHLINLFIFATYFLTLGTELDFLNSFIKVLFIILFVYITNAWCVKRILIYYGDEIEISGEKYFRKGYKASFFSFLTQGVFIIIAFFLTIDTLGINNYLQIGGIIAGALAFFGFTAPVWAPDVIAGIIILHNDRIQIGNVIKIRELGVEGWVKRISLSEIKIIDLTYNHPILLRPSKFRNYTIENLSAGIVGKKTVITRVMKIQVSYEVDIKDITELCIGAYEKMIQEVSENEKKFFPIERTPHIEISNFGNDAVEYSFFYEISSPFYIKRAEFILNTFLKEQQKKLKISFATPKLIDLNRTTAL